MQETDRDDLNSLAERVIGAVYEVANGLGAGFVEKVYERALAIELSRRGIRVRVQSPITIFYKGKVVGDYFADLLVEDQLIVELKCVQAFCDEHLAQSINYLKATRLHLALLVNFQRPKVEWKRVVNEF